MLFQDACPSLIFFVAFPALLIAIHLPFFKLPFFWDELGQFVPAALDIYQLGAWIPQDDSAQRASARRDGDLALMWKIFGFSIPATRIAMLVVGVGRLAVFVSAGHPAVAAKPLARRRSR